MAGLKKYLILIPMFALSLAFQNCGQSGQSAIQSSETQTGQAVETSGIATGTGGTTPISPPPQSKLWIPSEAILDIVDPGGAVPAGYIEQFRDYYFLPYYKVQQISDPTVLSQVRISTNGSCPAGFILRRFNTGVLLPVCVSFQLASQASGYVTNLHVVRSGIECAKGLTTIFTTLDGPRVCYRQYDQQGRAQAAIAQIRRLSSGDSCKSVLLKFDGGFSCIEWGSVQGQQILESVLIADQSAGCRAGFVNAGKISESLQSQDILCLKFSAGPSVIRPITRIYFSYVFVPRNGPTHLAVAKACNPGEESIGLIQDYATSSAQRALNLSGSANVCVVY